MQSEGCALTLGGLVSLVRGTTYKSALLGRPGPVLLGLASIQRDGGFRGDSLKTYGGESADKLLLRPGDLYVSLKDVTQSGDLLGAVARLPKSIVVGRLTQDTVKLVFDASHYPPSLLYWVLRAPEYRAYCRERAIGTTNLSLSRDDFLAFPLPASTKARMELVTLLETIEARIEVLRQANATLEAIAQALFKSWFIDFDPVRAKAEGREPEGMGAATAALFPAEFEESALGLIPKGWRAGSVSELAALNAASWTTRRAPSTVAYIDLAGVKANFFDPPQRLLFADAPSRARRELRSGDTLIGTVRPGNRSFGFIADAEPGLTGSTGFAVLSPMDPNAAAFVYLCATRDENIERLAALADGGAYPAVRPELVQATSCLLPSVDVLNAFHEVASPLLLGIAGNTQRSRLLAEVRDTLLPRLISGKLRLPEAQEQLEAALA